MRLRAENSEKEAELLKQELKGLREQLNEVSSNFSFFLVISADLCCIADKYCNFNHVFQFCQVLHRVGVNGM